MGRRGLVAGVVLLAAVACRDGTGPDGDSAVVFTVYRGAPSAGTVRVDSVTVVAAPTDSGATLGASAGAPFPVGADSLRIRLPLTLTADVASFQLSISLLASGAEVFRTRTTISARRGVETEVPSIEPATWQQLAEAGPPARLATGFALAPPLGGTIVFGGQTASGNDGSTWVFDGAVWQEQDFGAAPLPAARHAHAMAFDAARGQIVLFGGRVIGVAPFGDTWLLDGTGWQEATPDSAPAGRAGHAMAFDPRRGEVVLFGGVGITGVLGDTWVWDGVSWHLAGQNAGPAARSGHTMVWDPVRRRVVLFGGSNPDGVRADLWEWDGSRWERRDTHGDIPPRREHAAGWDPGRARLVIAGGQEGGVAKDDVWELTGDLWLPVEHQVGPGRRFGASMAPGPAGDLLLFGGRRVDGFLGDLWRYR